MRKNHRKRGTVMSDKIALIGAGNMGYAILMGIIKSGCCEKSNIVAADKSEECRKRAASEGVLATPDPAVAVSGASLVILAVKPNAFDSLAVQIRGAIRPGAVIVSILAGKTIFELEAGLGEDKKIIRVMPNTPALVGCGMSGLCKNKNASGAEMEKVLEIFGSFGRAAEVDESLMDIVTGISGSGPAYAFMFIDGMMRAGIKRGMSGADAKLFAAQTVLGAAKMVLESEDSPEQLKINVCSPGGTTIEAVRVFEENDLYGIIDRAIDACVEKSRLMSKS